ncbi:epididymal-specific lipocalin-9 [Rhynchocyon petersi]
MMVPLLLLSTGLSLATAQYFEPRMIVCRDFNMDKLSGAWCSISLASNNLTRIQKNGDLRVFIRTIENLKNNSLKFNFYFSLQGQCEPIAMVCEKTDQNGLCTITYEGKNTVRILETIYSIYVTFYLHKVRDGVEMRVLALYGTWAGEGFRQRDTIGDPRPCHLSQVEHLLELDDQPGQHVSGSGEYSQPLPGLEYRQCERQPVTSLKHRHKTRDWS